MNQSSAFFQSVRQTFDFLVRDFGYQLQRSISDDASCVIYTHPLMNVEFYWGKGELDVIFRVKVENEIFRPYRSRAFSLSEVIRYLDETAFNAYPQINNGAYITTLSDAENVLQFHSALMHKYCTGILSGDLSLFEKLTIEKRIT